MCITSSYNKQESAALPCTQPHMTTMFRLLNSPFYIDIICKEVLLGKVIIGMNSFWGGPMFWGMFLILWWPLLIILMNFCFQNNFFIWKVKRCLVLLSVVLNFLQRQMTSCIGLIVSISLIFMWLFPLVNLIVSTTWTSMCCHVLHKICFLYFFKVA